MVGLFGAGQVADEQLHIQPRQPVGGLGQGLKLLGAQAQAVHARIQMQAAGQGRIGMAARGVVFQLAGAVQDWDKPRLDQPPRRTGDRAIQDVDHRGPVRSEHGPQGLAFLQPSHMKTARALGPETPRDGRRAQAIAVGLDHRRNLSPARLGAEQAVIGRQGVQVDGQAGARSGHVRCLAQSGANANRG